MPGQGEPLQVDGRAGSTRRGFHDGRPVLRCGCIGRHAHHLLSGRSNRVSRTYYNETRPHRALGSHTSLSAFDAPLKAPRPKQGQPAQHFRVAALRRGPEVRVVRDDGLLIRDLILDPTHKYQGFGQGS